MTARTPVTYATRTGTTAGVAESIGETIAEEDLCRYLESWLSRFSRMPLSSTTLAIQYLGNWVNLLEISQIILMILRQMKTKRASNICTW
jgi:hypothetical protein